MTDADISPEVVETLAQAFDVLEYPQTAITIRALSAALTQSRAETAAAYERAARWHDDKGAELLTNWGYDASAIVRYHEQYAAAIRALATPDQSSALAAIEAAAEARGMRKAAAIAFEAAHNTNDISVIRDAILAAIPQGDTTND